MMSETPEPAIRTEFCLEELSRKQIVIGRLTLEDQGTEKVREYRRSEYPGPSLALSPGAARELRDALAAGHRVYGGTATMEKHLRQWLTATGQTQFLDDLPTGPPDWFNSRLRMHAQPKPAPRVPKPAPRAPKAPRSAPLPDLLKFNADRIHKGAVEAFSAAHEWGPAPGFFQAYEAGGDDQGFTMLCGFPRDPGPEIWKLLLSRGESAIKAHYALWARLYEQTGGRPGQYAMQNINQFCRDLGYKEHHNGGFKRERKQEAMRLLEMLTSMEVAVRFQAGKQGRIREVSGAFWQRGMLARERDQYQDLFGQAREGDPDLWDPAGFSYTTGPWFADPEWRRQNVYLGLIGIGLMKLQVDTDQTAIRIAGYLGTLARIGQYRTRRIRVETLLKRIGMAEKYPNNPARLQDNVEEGLEKVVGVAVLARWCYTDSDPTEPDMDDAETLAAIADEVGGPWRRKTLELEWPRSLQAESTRLAGAEQKALAASRKRSNSKEK